jgi:hypothetical protein
MASSGKWLPGRGTTERVTLSHSSISSALNRRSLALAGGAAESFTGQRLSGFEIEGQRPAPTSRG